MQRTKSSLQQNISFKKHQGLNGVFVFFSPFKVSEEIQKTFKIFGTHLSINVEM